MKKYPWGEEKQKEKKITSIEIWDGTNNFAIDEYLRRYTSAYAHWLQQAKETWYSFNVQHSLPVFLLPITYVDNSWKSITKNVVLETWMNSKFLDKDILENIKKHKDIDLLDVRYSVMDSNLDNESLVKIVREYIISRPECVEVLIKNYCEAQKEIIDFYQSKKNQLAVLKTSGKEILETMKCPLTENRGLVSPKSLEKIMEVTVSYTWKTHMDIEKYKENIFETLHISKGREYEDIDKLMTNLRDVDVMIENMEEQKKIFKTEIVDKIKNFDKEHDWILQIDSRFLFFENGDTMYDTILLKSIYNEYYFGECENLEKNFEKIKPYCYPFFVDLWCGGGTKDAILMKKYKEQNIPLYMAIFMDGSMSSLVRCDYNLNKEDKKRDSRYKFSTDWIDNMMMGQNTREGKGIHAFDNPNIPSNNEMRIGYNTMSEWPTTFSMRWGTFWCFGWYKEIFLQQMGQVMKSWDTFLVSLFSKPQWIEEKEEIIKRYDNKESEDFVLNFLQKIGISKQDVKFHVWYNEDKIEIFVDIDNAAGKGVEISAFGEKAYIENWTRMKIHESQRFDKEVFETLLKDTDCGLSIETIIKDKYWGPDIYVLKK